MTKFGWGLFVLSTVLVALVGFGVYYVSRTTRTDLPPQDAGTVPVATTTPVSDVGTPTFTFTPKGEDTSGVPQTKVSLMYKGATNDLGTYQGSCSQIASSSWPLLPGEQSGVICWWAGGGTELGIFPDDATGALIVKKGALDEGGADTAGVRGNFTTLLSL